MVQGGALEDCVRAANYAANYIIQQSGCQLPDKPNFSRDSVGFWTNSNMSLIHRMLFSTTVKRNSLSP